MANKRVSGILSVIADCRPEEVRSVLLMFLYSVLLGLAAVFYETAANALFLSQGGSTGGEGGEQAQDLPYVYLGATVITAAATAFFTRMEARVSLTGLLMGAQACLLLAVVAFRVGLIFAPGHPALLMLIRIWWEVMWMMGELLFWTLAGSLFNLQQGKRLFALIGSGEVLAEIVGGSSMAWVTKFLSVPDLLWVTAAGLTGCMMMPLWARKGGPGFADAGAASAASVAAAAGHGGSVSVVVDVGRDAHHSREGSRLSLRDILKNRYMTLILAMSAVNMGVWYFLDYSFYQQVESAYHHPDELAAFLGLFSAIVGIVNLLTKTVLAGWILTRFGVRTGLLSLPAALSVGTAAVLAVGLGMGSAAIFWPIVLCKLLEKVLNNSLHEPATRILYQPVSAEQRVTLQAVVEGMVAPLTAGVTGIALLGLTHWIADFDAFKAGWVLIGLLFLLITLTFSLSARYGETLAKSLARRSLDADMLSLNDGSSKKILERYLHSGDEMEVIYALNLIGDRKDGAIGGMLLGLLNHPSATVRQEALGRIEQLKPARAQGRVERLIGEDPSPAVAGAAVRTLVALGESDVLDKVAARLKDPRPEVRRGAMVGLLRDGGIEGVLAAGEHLVALVRSEAPAERAMAAEVLGQVGIRSFYRALLGLLSDPDPMVRRSALAASGHVGNPALWPLVVAALTAPALRATACSALAAGGESVLPALDAALDGPGFKPAERVLMLRTVRRIGGDEAIALLRKHMDHADGGVRREALLGLGQLGWDVDGAGERERIVGLIRRESGGAAWLLAGLEELREAGALSRAIDIEIKRSVDTIFLLLWLLYPSPAIRDARIHLDGDSPEKRALAVEIVDQFLTRELKDLVFPLVEDLPRTDRLARLSAVHPQEPAELRERLRVMVEEAGRLSAWTRACALYHMAGRADGPMRETVARAVRHPDPLVAETAAWVRTRPVDTAEPVPA